HYKRALDVEPKSAIILANYTEFLFCEGRAEDGAQIIAVMGDRGVDEAQQLAARTVAYMLSPDAEARRRNLVAVQGFLKDETYHADFGFDVVLAKAEDFGYVDMKFAKALAAVVNGRAKLDSLDTFSEWTDLE
ncbi:MAG: hypothetical protein JKY92_04015, partial [Magnetovibrio sp.]|nr:hypothetical protein [Magnetovibrio sp.]